MRRHIATFTHADKLTALALLTSERGWNNIMLKYIKQLRILLDRERSRQ